MALDKEKTAYIEYDPSTEVWCWMCHKIVPASKLHSCIPPENATLRDHLATAAPVPLREGDREDSIFAENCARRYRWADAMLEARKK